ncbi:Coenzyme F420 hydrogenase/dehydrogenase, beta subunit C-terminal domain [Phycisphaerales bacterium AB-hyl4]|uniref:Coenzyme F420 hydrogenase/dehydrogenase, beta subunit C-terminal domain n=1 Tax=Natronomicrosphaera hydrolytica TaxID=3242702 RepID=A0ABV4U2B9_9BACT
MPICPVDQCITLSDDQYPQVNAETCIECGLCERVCSGDKLPMDMLKGKLNQSMTDNDNPLGGFHDAHLVHAVDTHTRQRGASGGLVTQLLVRLLETGEIDGAIVAGMDPREPWKAVPMIARTPEAMRQVAGSKYTVVPMVRAMQQVIKQGNVKGQTAKAERFAMVGVACHVHSLRMMMAKLPSLRRKIRFVIGPLCKSSFDPEATTDLLRANGIDRDQVSRFEFRGGTWPGVMRAKLKDGSYQPLHQSNFRDGAYNYLMSLYTQPRCHLCYDFGNELADLTVGDPWGRDNTTGHYVHEGGHTLALPRTATGRWLIEFMQHDPAFAVGPADPADVQFHQRAAAAKRNIVQLRIDARLKRGQPVPKYDREMPRQNWRQRMAGRAFAATLWLGQSRRLRYWVLRLLLSRPATPLIWLRQVRKFGLRGCVRVNRMTRRDSANVQGSPTVGT